MKSEFDTAGATTITCVKKGEEFSLQTARDNARSPHGRLSQLLPPVQTYTGSLILRFQITNRSTLPASGATPFWLAKLTGGQFKRHCTLSAYQE